MNRKSRRITRALLREWPLPVPNADGDKEDRGRLLVIAGSDELPGAAILAGNAALRAGVGKLCIATARSAATSVAQAIPEARLVAFDASKRTIPSAAGNAADFDAIVIGPGMESSKALAQIVRRQFCAQATSLVVDAGALEFFAGSNAGKRAHSSAVRCVVTPHAGEMAHLLGIDKDEVQDRAADIAVTFAHAHRAVVTLKGATTYVADPDGTLWVHDEGNISLAASGSGDVLAGIIGALVARGATCAQAAVWGVALHALAGARLVAQHGTLGALAREIPDHIPSLMSAMIRQR